MWASPPTYSRFRFFGTLTAGGARFHRDSSLNMPKISKCKMVILPKEIPFFGKDLAGMNLEVPMQECYDVPSPKVRKGFHRAN